ncbi:UNVERIFIED_CONTAM: Copia protein [Sesamum radiatum]|uniref:Copia protein n=1 Tax=Sesamum radiatum TaxID=300843 RepID=A0AAW2JKL2_SESRA
MDQKKRTGSRDRGRGRDFTAVIAGESCSVQSEGVTNITDIIRSGLKKYMQGEVPLDHLKVNFAQLDNFAGKLVGNLYVLESSFSTVVPENNSMSINTHCNLNSCDVVLCNADLWHRRLGHLSKSSTKHITSLPQIDSTDAPCDVCPLAKMHKLPFASSAIRTKSTFDLVHMDIWGPYKEPTTFACHYFLTIVDDFSRSTWTFYMKYKSQSLETFQNFCKLVLSQFNKHVKCIRTQTTELNFLVSLSNLPFVILGDAILSATHLINRFPTAILAWKTPYEVLYDKPLSYSHLRTIGCLYYAIRADPRRSKFDKRGSKCVLIGYPPGQKAYKLYDLDSKLTFIFRDVQFLEHFFPFAHDQHPTDSFPLPTIPLTADIDDYILSPPPSENPATQSSPPSSTNTVRNTDSILPVRRSQRTHTKPSWLTDFVCHLTDNSSSPTITTFIPAYLGFVASLSLLQEPRSYRQASSSSQWVDAMNQELKALELNQTWVVVSLPLGKHAIGCKWVYKVKLKDDGSVERYKARLVAKGYTQVEGVDYTDRFSPITKSVMVRLFLAIATAFKWPIHQIDINNAFLHGHLEEESI